MEQTVYEIRNLKIQRKIYRLRHRDGKSWSEISNKIKSEFDVSYNDSKLQDMYDNYIARSQVISDTSNDGKKEALKVSKEWREEINKLIELLNDKVQKYLEMADELMVESYESGNRKSFFKDLPAFNTLLRSLQSQVQLLRDTQQKIQINQNNFTLNETQILQLVNKSYDQKEKDSGFFIHPGTQELLPTKKKKKELNI